MQLKCIHINLFGRKLIIFTNNPVRAGYVKEDFHWIYSSASNYQELESVIEVERIVQRLITYN